MTPQWFREAGAGADLISITRFVPNTDIFATREGGYGVCFAVTGIDPECLEEDRLARISAQVLYAMREIPEDFILYQTAIRCRGHVPPPSAYQECDNRVVAETQTARQKVLADSGLSTLDLVWTVYATPIKATRRLTPEKHALQTAAQLQRLTRITESLTVSGGDFKLTKLSAAKVCRLYGYISHLHAQHPPVSSFDTMAQQLAGETVRWSDHGLQVGQRHAKLFSLLRRPKYTAPDLFGELLRVDADMVLVFEVQRRTVAETRKEVSSQQTFKDIFREKWLTVLAHIGAGGQAKPMPASATGLAADKAVLTLSNIIEDLDEGLAYCHVSLIGLVHSADASELDSQISQVQRIAGQSEASMLSEGLGSLSAYCSLFPGASYSSNATNVRRWWLREDHAANLSMVYTPYLGEPHSETLEQEALAIFGTRDHSPFHYDPYANGLRGCIVLGESRRGKSFLLNFLVDQEAKYAGFISIYDVGGSYENTVFKHGGSVVRFGLDGPRLNPFTLTDTAVNRQFVYRLVKMLLVKGGAVVSPQNESGINERVDLMFSLPPAIRRLKHLVLPPELQPYLAKWIEGGVYGNIFDNVEDELRLSRIVVFDFEALSQGDEQKDLMEPLLCWVRWRMAGLTQDRANLGVPKLEIYDECWKHLRDEKMASMIVHTSKTAAKHLGGIMLATQSAEDLGAYANLIRANCPDALFLGGAFDRDLMGDLFKLNTRQFALIESLRKGESLLVRRNYSKVLRLTVDEQSKWLYSTHPQDRRRREEAIAKYGREAAFGHLVAAATAK